MDKANAPLLEDCAHASSYSCSRKVFSPDVTDGKSIENLCTDLPELSGQACLAVETFFFSTEAAAKQPDTPNDALLPGGEYNRDEFFCRHTGFFDEGSFAGLGPAFGEGDQLSAALRSASRQCNQLLLSASAAPGANPGAGK